MIEPDSQPAVDMLLDALRRDKVIPFVGAGMSAPFLFPTWRDFVHKIYRDDMGQAPPDNLEEALEAYGKKLEMRLRNRILQTYGRDPDEMSGGIFASAPVSLLPQLTPGPVITTNVDRVLDVIYRRANARFDDLIPSSYYHHLRRVLTENRTYLLMLHGRADEPETVVFTATKYDELYGSRLDGRTIDLTKPLPAFLYTLFILRSLLFLGCSLEEDRTIKVLRLVPPEFRGGHFAIVSSDRRGVIEDHLRSLGLNIIWYQNREGESHCHLRPLLEHLVKEYRRGLAIGFSDSTPVGLVGRSRELKQLAEFLDLSRTGERAPHDRILSIYGPPKVGKSALAAEALSRYDEYRCIELSDSTEEPLDFLSAVAEHLSVPPELATWQQVLKELRAARTVLKLEVPGERIPALTEDLRHIARARGIRILVVSERPLPTSKSLAVGKLGLDDARELFFRSGNPWRDVSPESPEVADFLKGDLGLLPAEISALAEHKRRSISFADFREQVLAGQRERPVREYYRHRLQSDPELAELFVFVTRFFPQGLSPRALRYVRSFWPAALELFLEFELFEEDESGIRRLIGPLVRPELSIPLATGLEPLESRAFNYFRGVAEAAWTQETAAIQEPAPMDGSRTRELLLELGNILRLVTSMKDRGDGWPERISDFGQLLMPFYQYDPALGERILSVVIQIETRNDLAIGLACSRKTLGDIRLLRGDHDKADAELQAALDLLARVPQERNDVHADAYKSCGNLYNAMAGRAEGEERVRLARRARGAFERAVELLQAREKTAGGNGSGPVALKILQAELGLADSTDHEERRRDRESLVAIAQSFERLARRLGLVQAAGLSLAYARKRVGDLRTELREFPAAEEAYLSAIQIYRERHRRDLGIALKSLGDLYRQFMLLEYAEEAYREALQQLQEDVGTAAYSQVLRSLGSICEQSYRMEEAKGYYKTLSALDNRASLIELSARVRESESQEQALSEKIQQATAPAELADLHTARAEARLRLGDPASAAEDFEAAATLLHGHDARREADLLLRVGDYLTGLDNRRALSLYARAEPLFASLGLDEWSLICLRRCAEIKLLDAREAESSSDRYLREAASLFSRALEASAGTAFHDERAYAFIGRAEVAGWQKKLAYDDLHHAQKEADQAGPFISAFVLVKRRLLEARFRLDVDGKHSGTYL